MERPKLKDLSRNTEVLIDARKFSLGRSLQNSCVVADIAVSRTHCVIEKIGDAWTLTDQSANGTFLNNKTVERNRPVALTDGDFITLADDCKFLFSNRAPATEISDREIEDITNALIADIEGDTTSRATNACTAAEALPRDGLGLWVVLDETNQTDEAAATDNTHSHQPKTVSSPGETVAVSEATTSTQDDTKEDRLVKTESAASTEKEMECIEDEFRCAICMELFIKAVTLNCSHTFCKHCIAQWRRQQAVCPICRAEITTLLPTKVVDNFIEKVLENASVDVKRKRRSLVEQREQSGGASYEQRGGAVAIATPSETTSDSHISDVTIVVSSSDESMSEWSDYTGNGSDWDTDQDDYDVVPPSYRRYGRCLLCGELGHVAYQCSSQHHS